MHLLADKHGAPLTVHFTGTNEHDKWSADDLIISIVVPRFTKKEQHLYADKGHDSQDVHESVE